MTVTVGRISLPGTFETWSESGRQVSAAINLYDSPQTVAWHIRQRENFANLLDLVVPITWTDDPTVDGFYRVTGVRVAAVTPSLRTGWMPVSLDLVALPHKRTASIEMATEGAARTGTPVTAQPWLAVPSSVLGWEDGASISRPMVDPDDPGSTASTVSFRTSTSSPDLYDHFSTALLAPASRYAEAPRVEIDGVVIHGRQDHDDFADLVVTNGGLRITKGTTALFSVEVVDLSGSSPYDWGTAWEVGPTYYDTVGATYTLIDPDDVVAVQVLEESAQQVAVRLVHATSSGNISTIDLHLRRGSWYAEVVVNVPWLASSLRPGMYLDNTAASLTGNYSIRTATTEGARYFAGMGVDSTLDVGNDSLYADSHTTKYRGYFGDPSGSSSDTPADIQAQAWAGQFMRETISSVRV